MKYIIKKIFFFILTLLIVVFLTFLAFQIIPGDPAVSLLGTEGTPLKVAALREEMGLNKPVGERFLTWVLNFMKGDMGISYSYQIPVSELITDKIPVTFLLTMLSFAFIICMGIPLGIYTSKHAGSRLDRLIMTVNQVTMAIPPFFLGIILTYLFGLVLKWFVPGGYISYSDDFFGFFTYLIFPAIAIAFPKSAMVVKLFRGSIIEEAKKDYVRTAYSRGNTINGVLYGHVLKNAILPVITFLAVVFADIIAGSIIIEQVFGIPGLGRMLITSIQNRDYPVVQAIIVCIAFVVLGSNLLADILLKVLDPRIKL